MDFFHHIRREILRLVVSRGMEYVVKHFGINAESVRMLKESPESDFDDVELPGGRKSRKRKAIMKTILVLRRKSLIPRISSSVSAVVKIVEDLLWRRSVQCLRSSWCKKQKSSVTDLGFSTTSTWTGLL